MAQVTAVTSTASLQGWVKSKAWVEPTAPGTDGAVNHGDWRPAVGLVKQGVDPGRCYPLGMTQTQDQPCATSAVCVYFSVPQDPRHWILVQGLDRPTHGGNSLWRSPRQRSQRVDAEHRHVLVVNTSPHSAPCAMHVKVLFHRVGQYRSTWPSVLAENLSIRGLNLALIFPVVSSVS
jgi:hypothetical protein